MSDNLPIELFGLLQTLLPPLRADQDPIIRLTLVKILRSKLQKILPTNESLSWLCNEITSTVFREENLEVKSEIFSIMVDKCNLMSENEQI